MASHPRPPYTVAPALASSPYYALSVAAYLAANPTITNPLASAAVFSCRRSRADAAAAADVDHAKEAREGEGKGEDEVEGNDDNDCTRLLLVQRAPADFLPLRWELPGGSADVGPGGDENLVDAAVRELWEEVSPILFCCSLFFLFFFFRRVSFLYVAWLWRRGRAFSPGLYPRVVPLPPSGYTVLGTAVGIFRSVDTYICVCVQRCRFCNFQDHTG